MRYKGFCSIFNECTGRTDTWDLCLHVISRIGPFTEFTADGRGARMRAMVGPQSNGNFLCLPSYGAGSGLAGYDDVFWNFERLSALGGPVDATALATALKYLAALP